MTAPPPPVPPIAVVSAAPGSRLEQLGAEYEIAYKAAEEAKVRLDAVVLAIKVEATNAAPGQPKVDIVASTLAQRLRMSARTTWRVDTNRLKAEHPEIYVACAKQRTTWELRRVAP